MSYIWKIYLVLMFLIIVSFKIGKAQYVTRIPEYLVKIDTNDFIGSSSNPTTYEIGGGNNYPIIKKADFIVENKKELLEALKKARSGQVVLIKDHSLIDLSGEESIIVPAGVTVAGNRGYKGEKGPMLFSNEMKTAPLFKTGGEGVRFTGLIIAGPDTNKRTEELIKLAEEHNYYKIPFSRGIQSEYGYLEVDNCELYGWSHAAILIQTFTKNKIDHNFIHHCYIHHNQRRGLGYGICLDNATALIEANIFDYNRHSIAGTGRIETSYEACYNLVLENANGHAFDMHGGADRKEKNTIAGSYIYIHHNDFKLKSNPSFLIRGVPFEKAVIYNNAFSFEIDDKNVLLETYRNYGRVFLYKNLFRAQKFLKK